MPSTRASLGIAAVALALLLSACSAATPSSDSGSSGSGSGGASSDASSDDGAVGDAQSAVDACALVPAAELQAALGVDPGAGVAEDGAQGLEQCTWQISDTRSVIAQYTEDADAFLPDSLYPKPDGADDVAGATRGYASAATGTVLVVKGGEGLMLNDIAFGTAAGDQAAWAALGDAIAAQL